MTEKNGFTLIARLKKSLYKLFLDALFTCAELFKIIIPISIATRFLQQWGIIDQFGLLLAPVMELVGLPGQLGLVWATAMATSIYGGMVVFASVAPGLELTVAQVTVLGGMILVAHGLPVELRIAQKAGTRFRAMTIIRIGGALVFGWLLHLSYQFSNTLQQANQALWNPATIDPTWKAWLVSEVRMIVMVFLIILSLMIFLLLLKKAGISDLMTRLLEPILTSLGMSRAAAPITIVGMTLGLSYGGGLIIQEAQSGRLSQQDIFSSIALMGLCHGIFEDTLLLMVLGAHLSGIFWGRLLFSLLTMWLLTRLIKLLPQSFFDHYLMRRKERAAANKEVRC